MIAIDGFSISGYMGFGKKLTRIGPFKKMNFFIGRNNSGKSSILRFIVRYWNDILQSKGVNIDIVDIHKGMNEGACPFEIAFSIDGELFNELSNRWPNASGVTDLKEKVAVFFENCGINIEIVDTEL